MATMKIRAGVGKGEDGSKPSPPDVDRGLQPAPTGRAVLHARHSGRSDDPKKPAPLVDVEHESVRHLEERSTVEATMTPRPPAPPAPRARRPRAKKGK